MRYLLLFLFIPVLSTEAKAPGCDDLSSILRNLDKQIREKRISPDTCSTLTPQSFLYNQELPSGYPAPETTQALTDYRCKDLSAVELQIKSIENELALFEGIAQLKLEINQGIEKLKTVEKPEMISMASKAFAANLEVARNLELFLDVNNENGENVFLTLSRAIETNWDTPQKLKDYLKDYCKTHKISDAAICKDDYIISENLHKEISGFIKVGAESEQKFSPKHIEELQQALAIQKNGEEYSYDQLSADLPGLNAEGFTDASGIKALKEMPPLTGDSKFSFLNGLKTAKDLLEVKSISSKFQFLLNDLKKRQEWEMKSKLSIVMFEQAENIDQAHKEVCKEATTLSKPVKDCLDHLVNNKSLQSLEQAQIKDIMDELTYGENHLKLLSSLEKSCVLSDKLEIPQGCFEQLNKKQAELLEKSLALNALKAKMLEDSDKLIAMRNFALEQFQGQECTAAELSEVRCDGVSAISQQAVFLGEDVLGITLSYIPKEEGTDISGYCKEKEQKTYEEKLCAFLEDEEEDNPMPKLASDIPTSPEQYRNPSAEAAMNVGGSLLGLLGQIMAQNRHPPNPYPMYPMGNYPTTPVLSISDSLLYPQASRGFGYYSPTPGAMPYSAFGKGMSSSASYNFGSASYFNKSVGW